MPGGEGYVIYNGTGGRREQAFQLNFDQSRTLPVEISGFVLIQCIQSDVQDAVTCKAFDRGGIQG